MTIDRTIINSINFLKEKFPIISLSGPRQSGKTTFLKDIFPGYTYVTMEDIGNRHFLYVDPKGFFEKHDCYVIFDEAQRSPELFSHLQTIVDDKKIMGQYILTGSHNFLLIKNISQSLAGRVALFNLFPFDFSEMKSENLLKDNYPEAMLTGFYPAIFDRNIPSNLFYSNYIKTFVERDISDYLNIRDVRTFRKFIALLANRAGQILNLNSVARECGITQPTATNWLSILEASYVVFLLPPYYENFDKRVIKSPKLYFYDTGLVAHLIKIKNQDILSTHNVKGALFENMIIAEYVKQSAHKYLHYDFFYFRDSNGNEVDLLVETPDGLQVIEIKSTKTISYDLFKGINYFYKLANDNTITRKLIYAGDENEKRSDIEIISWKNLNI